MLKELLENEKGGAMLIAIMGLAVILIFTMAAIFMGSSNTLQTQREGKRTQAYYVADAGAQTLVKHLKGLDKKEAKKMLEEMKTKTDNKEVISGTYEEWDFYIKVKDISQDENIEKYEVKSIGKVNDVEDWTIAEITLMNEDYHIGKGQIFVNSDEQINMEKVPQLEGEGLNIYTNAKKKMDKENPIFIKEGVSELFLSINDRKGQSDVNEYTIGALNSQRRDGYSLEIQETELGTEVKDSEVIGNNNLVKSDTLTKYKKNKNEKNQEFKNINFRYDIKKQEVLKYFSNNKLSGKNMLKTEMKKGLESTFLIPIKTEKEYEDYIDPNNKGIYPKSPEINLINFLDSGVETSSSNPLSKNEHIKIEKGENIKFSKGIHLKEGGNLDIKTEDDTNIKINGKIAMQKGSKITINTSNNINVYIKDGIDIYGDIIAPGSGQVNFYMYEGKEAQLTGDSESNRLNIENINLYAPNSKITLGSHVNYTGVIVGKEVEFGDRDSTFKSPSGGVLGTNNSCKIEVEWKH